MKKNLSRVFVAFPFPEETKAAYADYIKDFLNVLGVRWTRVDNLHITLFFIGEVEEENIPAIRRKLQPIKDNWKSFELNFEKITFRGKAHSPGMIWAQFEPSNEFADVSRTIHSVVAEYMIVAPQHLDPIPHITLARLKKGADLMKIRSNELSMPIKLPVDKMELWKTVQSVDGAIYQRIDMDK